MLFFHPALFARIIIGFALAAVLCHPATGLCEKLVQTGVVQVESLNMRRAPDKASPVIRALEKGVELRILNESEEWFQVIHDQEIGYIYNNPRYLERYTRHKVTGDDTDMDREVAMARAREIERRIQEKKKEVRQFSVKEDAVIEDLEEIDHRISQKRRQIREVMEAAEQASARIMRLEAQAEEIRAKLEHRKEYAGRRLVALYKICRRGEMSLLATADSVHQLFSRKAAIEQVLAHDEKVITELVEVTRRLNRVISRLAEKRAEKRSLAKRYEESLTELAAREEERKSVLASLKSGRSKREDTLKYLRESVRRLNETVSDLDRRRDKAAGDFDAHQGLLKMPVQGKIISTFGKHVKPDSGALNYQNGIEIRAEQGEPVKSVFAGEIAFADWVKGYGRVVIVDHGSSYHSVYAHVEDLFNGKGDTVESDQVIATVGDSGSISGPALYFEIRHRGDPVDPLQWLDHG
ncbi:MAG: peptidoglycan DD-metalloendopeptidase family protein [Desulfobacterales bacterium]|nr:peptidoglycan DD-metalloendopeptidase family protein [Desulfobacterales bacterium]MBS3755871.1 peptidoglycan DD-metalloendopeptidase family protein [Desulfobacterales bacterium]